VKVVDKIAAVFQGNSCFTFLLFICGMCDVYFVWLCDSIKLSFSNELKLQPYCITVLMIRHCTVH